AETVVEVVAEKSCGSFWSLSPLQKAVTENVPVCDVPAITLTCADSPALRVPIEQSTALDRVMHEPTLVDAETAVIPAGSGSANLVWLNVDGPLSKSVVR